MGIDGIDVYIWMVYRYIYNNFLAACWEGLETVALSLSDHI